MSGLGGRATEPRVHSGLPGLLPCFIANLPFGGFAALWIAFRQDALFEVFVGALFALTLLLFVLRGVGAAFPTTAVRIRRGGWPLALTQVVPVLQTAAAIIGGTLAFPILGRRIPLAPMAFELELHRGGPRFVAMYSGISTVIAGSILVTIAWIIGRAIERPQPVEVNAAIDTSGGDEGPNRRGTAAPEPSTPEEINPFESLEPRSSRHAVPSAEPEAIPARELAILAGFGRSVRSLLVNSVVLGIVWFVFAASVGILGYAILGTLVGFAALIAVVFVIEFLTPTVARRIRLGGELLAITQAIPFLQVFAASVGVVIAIPLTLGVVVLSPAELLPGLARVGELLVTAWVALTTVITGLILLFLANSLGWVLQTRPRDRSVSAGMGWTLLCLGANLPLAGWVILSLEAQRSELTGLPLGAGIGLMLLIVVQFLVELCGPVLAERIRRGGWFLALTQPVPQLLSLLLGALIALPMFGLRLSGGLRPLEVQLSQAGSYRISELSAVATFSAGVILLLTAWFVGRFLERRAARRHPPPPAAARRTTLKSRVALTVKPQSFTQADLPRRDCIGSP